jgi:predicted ATPase
MATKGHAASEVGQTYARALVLCQQVGETPHRFPTLQGLCQFYHSRGEFSTAREEASGRGDLLAEAYRLQGTLLLRQAAANTARAEACFQQALAIARRQQAKSWELRAAVSLGRLW